MLFDIVSIVGKGRGVIARVPIVKGTVVLAESPLSHVVVPGFKRCAMCLSSHHTSHHTQCIDVLCNHRCEQLHSILHHKLLCPVSIPDGPLKNFPRLVNQLISRIWCTQIATEEEKQLLEEAGWWLDAHQIIGFVNTLCFVELDDSERKMVRIHYDLLTKWFVSSGKLQAPVPISQLIPWNLYLRIYSTCKLNTFGLHVDEEELNSSIGLFGLASMFNHSCDANCQIQWQVNSVKPHAVIKTQRNITSGEELTVLYVSPELSAVHRNSFLLKHYGFTCTCSLCSSITKS
jgi:hypothetical protein